MMVGHSSLTVRMCVEKLVQIKKIMIFMIP